MLCEEVVSFYEGLLCSTEAAHRKDNKDNLFFPTMDQEATMSITKYYCGVIQSVNSCEFSG